LDENVPEVTILVGMMYAQINHSIVKILVFLLELEQTKADIILAGFVEKNSIISRAMKMYELELANNLTANLRAFCKKWLSALKKRSQAFLQLVMNPTTANLTYPYG
jgi:hypothetical protein